MQQYNNVLVANGRTALHYAIAGNGFLSEGSESKRKASSSSGSVWKVKASSTSNALREVKVLACIECLLALSADVNVSSNLGSMPLHSAVSAKMPAVVDLLCSRGALTSCPDKLSRTPLHLAAWVGSSQSVSTLLQHGSDPNLKNGAGK